MVDLSDQQERYLFVIYKLASGLSTVPVSAEAIQREIEQSGIMRLSRESFVTLKDEVVKKIMQAKSS